MKKIIKYLIDKTIVKFYKYLIFKSGIFTKKDFNKKLTIHKVLWDKAIVDSSVYVENRIDKILLFEQKNDLWNYTISKIKNKEGLNLEFGVFKGLSINYFSSRLPNLKFYGFDSFIGLKEDWIGHHRAKGAFNLEGILPKVSKNVELIPGWFDETIPNFIKKYPNEKISFLHIDGDTYEAAKIVLELLKSKIGVGTLIVFDEYLGYPNWRNGEFKAWGEFVKENNIKYNYIAFSTEQAAIIITD